MADRTVKVNAQLSYQQFVAGAAKVGQSSRQMMSDFEQAQQRAAKANQSLGDVIKKNNANLAEHRQNMRTVTDAAGVMGAGLLAATGMAVRGFMGFDKQMSAVSAATRASAADMDTLRAAALKAGADTSFSASQAAEGEEALAKAGVSVTNIVNGGLKGSLDLAAAGNIAVGDSADLAATAMTVFGLSGAQIPHVADLIAAAAGKAQGDVSDMGMALKQVALVANQTGLSIEDTSGALALFASNGLIGSDAGTSFKTMLMSLNPNSDEAAQLMDDLGINAYDAQGKFVGLSKYAGILQNALSGMSTEQQNATLKTIFGSDAIRAATILFQAGSAGVDQWTAAVDDQGYAADQAGRRLDNLSGDVEKLRGSLETAFIQAGSGANGILRDMTQAATGAVNAFGNLPAPVQQGVLLLGGLAGTVLTGVGAFGAMAPKVRETREALQGLGSTGQKADKLLGWMGRTAPWAIGIGALAFGAKALYDHFTDVTSLTPSVEDFTRSLGKLGDSGGDLAKADISAQHLAASMRSVLANADSLSNRTKGSFGAMGQAFRGDIKGGLSSAANNQAMGLSAKEARQEVTNLDQALAQMAMSGGAAKAQQAFSALSDEMVKQGMSAADVAKLFPAYTQAVNDAAQSNTAYQQAAQGAAQSAQVAAENVSVYGSAMATAQISTDEMASAMADADQALKALNDSYDYFIGKNVDFVTANKDMVQALTDATTAFGKNGASLSVTNQAGRDNIGVVAGLIENAHKLQEATLTQTGSMDQANGAYWRQIGAIRQLMIDSGMSANAVDTLLGSMLGVAKTKVVATITANTKQAADAIKDIAWQMTKLQDKTVRVHVVYDSSGNAVSRTINPGAANSITARASGGPIYGTGARGVDSVMVWSAPGEYVLNDRRVNENPSFIDTWNWRGFDAAVAQWAGAADTISSSGWAASSTSQWAGANPAVTPVEKGGFTPVPRSPGYGQSLTAVDPGGYLARILVALGGMNGLLGSAQQMKVDGMTFARVSRETQLANQRRG